MRDIKNTIRVDVTFPHDTSHQVQIVTEDFREFIQLFDQKNREYGSENAFVLGSAGQFADIWRKIGKLKTALWDKKPEQLTSEGTEEIIYDLMGHLFLTLQCLRRDSEAQSKSFVEQHDDDGESAKRDNSEDKPVLTSAGMDTLSPFSLPNDDREYRFESGDRVRSTNKMGWLAQATGVIIKQDRASAGLWYKVNFGPKAGEITCSDSSLDPVK